MSHIPREVFHQPQFEKELREIESDIKRVDEFVRGAEWQICRDPESGKMVEGAPNVWGVPITDIPDQPPLVLYYTFNDRFIWLISIKISHHPVSINWLE